MPELLSVAVEQVAHAVEADRGSLWLASQSEFQLVASYGLRAEASSRWKRELLASRYGALCRQVLSTAEPLLVPDAQVATLDLESPVGCFGDQALLAVPVMAGGRALGALVFSRLDPGLAFTTDDGAYASVLAAEVAMICHLPGGPASQLAEVSPSQVVGRFGEIADRLARATSEASSPDSLLDELASIAADALHSAGGWLLGWDPGQQELRVLAVCSQKGEGGKLARGARLRPHQAVESIADTPSRSLSEVSRELRQAILPVGAEAALGGDLAAAIPIVAQGELMGVLLTTGNESMVDRPPPELFASLAALSMALASRRDLENSLGERAHLRAAVDNLPEGLLVIDAQDRVIAYNRRAQELLGRRASEIFGQPLSTALSLLLSGATDAERFQSELSEALAQIDVAPTLRLEFAQPDSVRLDLRLFPVRAESGQKLGWGAVLRDASAANEAAEVGLDIVTGLSQELRTPLATIKGCTTTLLTSYSRWDEEASREFLSIIDAECDRLHSLVENVFDASRIANGSLVIRKQAMSLLEVVQAIVGDMKWLAARVQMDIPQELPHLPADPARIGEVLRHLIENAGKFSPSESRIGVRAAVVDGELQVSVSDSGIGIPPEYHEKVFERFFCVGSPASKPAEGLGLGLAIARSIVNAHRGRIWVESAPGKGSVFSFALPLSAPPRGRPRRGSPTAARPAGDRREEAGARARAARPAKRPCVLVVDDETRILRFIRANLEAGGYKVLVATDGAAAIRLVEAEEPDLVLLDIMLPDVDGFEVLQRVRQFSVVPVIMITARTDESDRIRGLNLGADDYLTKPFSPDELMARVGAVMRRTRFADEMEPRPTLLCGDLAINFAQRRVTRRGSEVRLSPTEYKLLYELAINAGRILSHEDLLQRVWGPQYRNESAYLWTYVRHLRRKLEDRPDEPRYILTEPGVGYTFALPG